MSHRTLNILAWTGSSHLELFRVRLSRCPPTVPLRYLDRCGPVQRDPLVSGAPLQGVSSGVTPFRFPLGLPRTFAHLRTSVDGLTAM